MDKDKTTDESQGLAGSDDATEDSAVDSAGQSDASGGDGDDEDDRQGDRASSRDETNNLLVGLLGIVFWLVILGIFGFNYFGLGDPVADIVVTASPKYNASDAKLESWSLNGHVIYDDDFISDVPIWAIAVDQRGNRKSTGKTKTDAKGSFTLTNIPNSLSGEPNQTIVEIEVYAGDSITRGSGDDAVTIELNPKSARIEVGSDQQYRVINLPFKELIVIGSIFTLSVAVALVPVPQGSKTTAWLVVKYLSSVFFAFLLTGFMVLYISLGLKHVNQTASNIENEILSLGVASIYKGRYVDDVPDEWLISLTSPTFARPFDADSSDTAVKTGGRARGSTDPSAAGADSDSKAHSNDETNQSEKSLERGFGVPLWVLLVSVIGSALFTISIILVGIKEAPLQLAPQKIRERIQVVVLHQFYILFAPIGAIFVYQLLVMAGAASQTVSVAIIALAAGVALNYLLELARKRVENLIGRDRS